MRRNGLLLGLAVPYLSIPCGCLVLVALLGPADEFLWSMPSGRDVLALFTWPYDVSAVTSSGMYRGVLLTWPALVLATGFVLRGLGVGRVASLVLTKKNARIGWKIALVGAVYFSLPFLPFRTVDLSAAIFVVPMVGLIGDFCLRHERGRRLGFLALGWGITWRWIIGAVVLWVVFIAVTVFLLVCIQGLPVLALRHAVALDVAWTQGLWEVDLSRVSETPLVYVPSAGLALPHVVNFIGCLIVTVLYLPGLAFWMRVRRGGEESVHGL